MNWFTKLFHKPTWEYHGCATATTTLVDSDGNPTHGGLCRGDYLLEERSDGKRRYKVVGYPGNSANANYVLACVEAWVLGSDLPEGILGDGEPKPRKAKAVVTKKKPTAKLIVFPGGKP